MTCSHVLFLYPRTPFAFFSDHVIFSVRCVTYICVTYSCLLLKETAAQKQNSFNYSVSKENKGRSGVSPDSPNLYKKLALF